MSPYERACCWIETILLAGYSEQAARERGEMVARSKVSSDLTVLCHMLRAPANDKRRYARAEKRRAAPLVEQLKASIKHELAKQKKKEALRAIVEPRLYCEPPPTPPPRERKGDSMAGFQKPRPLKAALKIGVYGPAGAGKTFTSLLVAEELARHTQKRVAYVDTEGGTNFYSLNVAERAVHPAAFDYDVLHTKSITEVLQAVRELDTAQHGVVVVDSISHLWDSAKNAYAGKTTKLGGIPLQAWQTIKKPYRDLMTLLLSSPLHVIICGRQGVDYGEDETSGELKSVGYKMRAEGETQYEPDVLLRLESFKLAGRKKNAVPVAHVEKDRTGVLAGKTIEWPSFGNIAQPLLGLLGAEQAPVPDDDEVGIRDADNLARMERDKERRSAELAEQYAARFVLAASVHELEHVGGELTRAVKKEFVPQDLDRVRTAYGDRLAKLKPANDNGKLASKAKAPSTA